MIRHLIRSMCMSLVLVYPALSWETVELDPAVSVLSSGVKLLSKGSDYPLYWYLSGLISKSDDNGDTWTSIEWADVSGITAVRLLGREGIAIAGEGLMSGSSDPFLKISEDGGETWETQNYDSYFRATDMVDWNRNMMLVGFDETNKSDLMGMLPRNLIVLRKMNGETSMEQTLSIDSVSALSPVFYQVGPNSFLLVFAKGLIFNPTYETYKSDDDGASWTKLENLNMHPRGAMTVKMLTPPNVFYAAAGMAWLKTVDGGETWTADSAFKTENGELMINDMAFADSLHGVAVSRTGAIMRTNDGGESWSVDTSTYKELLQTGQQCEYVFAVDASRFWISGTKGLLWRDGYDDSESKRQSGRPSMATRVIRVEGKYLQIDRSFAGGVLSIIRPDGRIVRRIADAKERTTTGSFSLPGGFYFLSVEKNGRKIGAYLRLQ